MLNRIALLFLIVLGASCREAAVPKPAAQLRLEYDEAFYQPFTSDCPFDFEINSNTVLTIKQDCNMTLNYPQMKASIFITYKKIDGNLETLLRDAQKLTYEHVIKADDIIEQPFINPRDRVYGMLYRVGGNAATNAQFYATDSVRHFLTGSLYFYAKPNFDSILPATHYLKNDMEVIMESLRWK
jgi:gliding motility-associated lipoprotein GldD